MLWRDARDPLWGQRLRSLIQLVAAAHKPAQALAASVERRTGLAAGMHRILVRADAGWSESTIESLDAWRAKQRARVARALAAWEQDGVPFEVRPVVLFVPYAEVRRLAAAAGSRARDVSFPAS